MILKQSLILFTLVSPLVLLASTMKQESTPTVDQQMPVVAPVAPPAVVRATIPPKVVTTTIRMEVTAYCPCRDCCGEYSRQNPDGTYCNRTASMLRVDKLGGRKICAADTRKYPFGTKMYVPNFGEVEVQDRGGAIKGEKIDLLMLDTPGQPGSGHQKALKWGRRFLYVTVVK